MSTHNRHERKKDSKASDLHSALTGYPTLPPASPYPKKLGKNCSQDKEEGGTSISSIIYSAEKAEGLRPPLMDIGKEDGLVGQALQKFVREQIAEKRKYEEAQQQHEAERRREEEEREERRRRRKSEEEDSKKLSREEKKKKEKSGGDINNLVGKWPEDEPEQWLEEIEFLFETYDVSPAERALLLTKHLDGKAKVAHQALERDQLGDMAAVREAIAKACEITPERWRQRF
ncbi:troponin I-like [Macrobrachium rosenbergii]|uniref:troponin I-like n=1 Tax=Macrobrachium rosenbergii TaxID=79674 RepID=UPI0034D69192